MTFPAASAAGHGEPPPGRLFVGAIVADRSAWAAAEGELAHAFGAFEPCLLALPFDHTDYYRGEMGAALLRVFRFFRAPVPQDGLAAAKRRTAEVERRFAVRSGAVPRRRVNIDPGIMTAAGVVLASFKGYAHRVYLGAGVHAEVELVWRGGGFRPLAWTYPDYRRVETLDFFTRVRREWVRDLRAGRRARGAEPDRTRMPVAAGPCS